MFSHRNRHILVSKALAEFPSQQRLILSITIRPQMHSLNSIQILRKQTNIVSICYETFTVRSCSHVSKIYLHVYVLYLKFCTIPSSQNYLLAIYFIKMEQMNKKNTCIFMHRLSFNQISSNIYFIAKSLVKKWQYIGYVCRFTQISSKGQRVPGSSFLSICMWT